MELIFGDPELFEGPVWLVRFRVFWRNLEGHQETPVLICSKHRGEAHQIIHPFHSLIFLCSCTYCTYVSKLTKYTYAFFQLRHWSSSTVRLNVLRSVKCSWSWCCRWFPLSLEEGPVDSARVTRRWVPTGTYYKSASLAYITMTSSPSTTEHTLSCHNKNSPEI